MTVARTPSSDDGLTRSGGRAAGTSGCVHQTRSPAGTELGATTALLSSAHRENGTGCPPSPAWIDVVASAGSLPSRETVSIHSPTALFAGRAKTKLSRARVMLT